jgi:ubiquinone/menaquinone biosynthesis C-methylase UbiE
MNARQIDNQYSTGLSRSKIEQALIAAGKDLSNLQPDDLADLEDFHTLGRIATGQLADLAKVTNDDHVLDAGSGIGGTARFLAEHFGCTVTAIDLTEEYCETARWLNQLVGLDDRISVRAGDVTDLPFDPGRFTAIFSQHVQMNVTDKVRLYQEAKRVLATGGRLAVWDITSGTPGELDFPVPWADQPDLSHLVPTDQLRAVIEAAGFAVTHWADLTEQAATFMRVWLSAPPGPLGLHAFIDNFAQKADNLVAALTSGRLRVIQGLARARA